MMDWNLPERTMPGGDWVLPDGSEDPLWVPDGCRFDPAGPESFLHFCKVGLRWPTGYGAGDPVVFAQWQIDRLINPMFGVVDEDGNLVTETVFLMSARGIGKTTLAGAVGLYGLTSMGVASPEVDVFAVSKEQAGRVFEQAARLVKGSPALAGQLAVHSYRRRIEYAANDGSLVVRSGDADAELGHNPSMVLFDELLAQRNRRLWDAVVTSMGKRPHSMLLVLTTPATKVETFAKLEYDQAKRIENDRQLDRSYLPVIFESDPEDDPWDEATWHKACPALKSGFLDINIYRREAARAKRDPEAKHAFHVFRLAQWAQSGAGFLNMQVWDENAGPLPEAEELQKLVCFFGLDMAGTTDLASLAILWVDKETEDAYVLWRHWSTEEQFERMDGWTSGAWRTWKDDQSVSLSIQPGNWINADAVARQVIEDYDMFTPWQIGFDSFRSRDMNRLLGEEGAGLPVQFLSQTGRAMQAATERIQTMVVAGKLKHNGDKIARWAAASTEVKTDAYGYPKLVKANLQERAVRIDAIDALNMAVDRWCAWERDAEEEEESRVWVI